MDPRTAPPTSPWATEAGQDLPTILRLFPAEARSLALGRARRRRVPGGTSVGLRGEPCEAALVVLSGILVVCRTDRSTGDSEISVYVLPGDIYGTHARLPGATHDFDVIAPGSADLELLEIPGDALRDAFAADAGGGLEGLTSPAVRRVVFDLLAQGAAPDSLLRLAGALRRRSAPDGAELIARGAPSSEWLILEEGSVRYGERVLGGGEDLGLDAILLEVPSPAAAICRGEATVLSVGREALADLLRDAPDLRRALGARLALTGAQHNRWPHVVLTDHSAPPDALVEESGEVELPDDPHAPSRFRRLPFFRQREYMDCGAACLQMIARYWGHELSYRALTALAGVDRHGSSLLDLARGAERIGFSAMGIKADWDTLRHVDLPAIAHLLDRHHYVVLWRVGRDSVTIGDPAFATRVVPRAELLRSWKGMLLVLRPTDRMEEAAAALPPGPDEGGLRRLFGIARPYARAALEVLFISMALQAVSLAVPVGSQVLLDRVVMRSDDQLLPFMLGGLLGAAALTGILVYARSYLMLEAATRIERDVIQTLYRRIIDSVVTVFQRYTTTDILNRFFEVGLIRVFIIDNAVTITIDLVMLLCAAAVMLAYSPLLAALALAAIPVQLVVTYLAGLRIRDHTAAQLNRFDAYQTHIMDSCKAFETVKAHGLERSFTLTMQRLLAPVLEHGFGAARHGAAGASAALAIDAAAAAVVLWAGARQALAGAMSVGELFAFILISRQVGAPVLRLAGQWRDYQRTRANVGRVAALLDIADEAPRRATAVIDLPRIRGVIRFRGVSFHYGSGPDAASTLARVDLEIAAGEVVGLVGPSGCGKSTLVRMLLRLHDPSEGTISIDGYNLRDVSPDSLRRQIGLVTQDVQLLSGSVYENIACGRDVREEAVIEAAHLAGAYEFVSALPYGFHTMIGERGLPLSGGQRQRIVIARALATDPRILIFDEATAALDPLSEQLIHERLRDIVRGRTTLIISHRIQTLQHADRIIVMNEGRISQVGTHESLIRVGGKMYSALALASPNWRRSEADDAAA